MKIYIYKLLISDNTVTMLFGDLSTFYKITNTFDDFVFTEPKRVFYWKKLKFVWFVKGIK